MRGSFTAHDSKILPYLPLPKSIPLDCFPWRVQHQGDSRNVVAPARTAAIAPLTLCGRLGLAHLAMRPGVQHCRKCLQLHRFTEIVVHTGVQAFSAFTFRSM